MDICLLLFITEKLRKTVELSVIVSFIIVHIWRRYLYIAVFMSIVKRFTHYYFSVRVVGQFRLNLFNTDEEEE